AIPVDGNIETPTYAAISTEDGTFELDGLPDGVFVLLAAHDDYVPAYHTDPEWNDGDYIFSLDFIEYIELGMRETLTDVDIYLMQKPVFGGVVAGNVMTDGNELRLAIVYAYNEQGEVLSGGVSMFEGEYSVTSLPDGVYTVEAIRIGFEDETYAQPIEIDVEQNPVEQGILFDMIPADDAIDDDDQDDILTMLSFNLDQNC
ncbi:MAG: carboxypeptidase regulatory-like domain-containing protein, partial [Planctomycetes bacterium]|nr:carboxypeptidase regulatory-like domain-containing protein [Planctomycetota bacterium]